MRYDAAKSGIIDRLIGRKTVCMLLIALTGLIAYMNTLHAPFQFDDRFFITANPGLIHPFSPPPDLDVADPSLNKTRMVTMLSFALNLRLGGFETAGYHALNITIHLIDAMLVFGLAALLMRDMHNAKNTIPLIAALVFAAHPLHTQAVTYISQRATELATLFYLSTIVLYGHARAETRKWRRNAFALAALLCTASAMNTKEIAFTLPLALALYEFMFLEGPRIKRIAMLTPFLLMMAILPVLLIDFSKSISGAIGGATIMSGSMDRATYMMTQFGVVTHYLRLFLFPVGQNLDYDWPAYNTFAAPQVFLPFAILALLFGLGIFHIRRDRVISFGILFYFLALSVESSVIVLTDIIFEHRAYLPDAGLAIAIAALTHRYTGRGKGRQRAYIVIAMILVAALTVGAYKRNHTWGSEVRLWQDTKRKSPHKIRPFTNLASAYISEGRPDDAMRIAKEALAFEIDPGTLVNLGASMLSLGKNEEAIKLLKNTISDSPNASAAYKTIGLAYMRQNNFEWAKDSFNMAAALNPLDADIYSNMSSLYGRIGDYSNALHYAQKAVDTNPYDSGTYINLALAHASMKNYGEAEAALRKSIALRSGNALAHYNLALIYIKSGNREGVQREYDALMRLQPDLADKLLKARKGNR